MSFEFNVLNRIKGSKTMRQARQLFNIASEEDDTNPTRENVNSEPDWSDFECRLATGK